MLERRLLGHVPPKPHTAFQLANGEKGYELVFTRDGFSGGFATVYLEREPTRIKSNTISKLPAGRLVGEVVDRREYALARRHVKAPESPIGKDLVGSRTALFLGSGTRVSALRGRLASEYGFTNSDADELYFFYKGAGQLLTMFGVLEFKAHDYVLIPRGVPYAFEHQGDIEGLLIEGDPHLEIPGEFRNPHGQLKLEAPYTHRDFRSPTRLLNNKEQERFMRIVTLRDGQLAEHEYSEVPFKAVGWDSSVYPMAFDINDYLPKTGKVHLPPNLHLTFRSNDFVVCSFVPRMVDYLEGSIPCPYPHANAICDEILYYVSGNFTSRTGIGPQSISHHPAGIIHGPQPGRYHGSIGHKSTDELAVMVDTWKTLQITKAAMAIEDKSYQTSWE